MKNKIYLLEGSANFKLPSNAKISSVSEDVALLFLKTDYDIVNLVSEGTKIDLYQKTLIKLPMRQIWDTWDTERVLEVANNDIIIIVNNNGEGNFNFIMITFK
jgi:hypothetical protein